VNTEINAPLAETSLGPSLGEPTQSHDNEATNTARDVKLVLYIRDDLTRQKYLTLLQHLIRSGALLAKLPRYRFEMASCDSREQAMVCLRDHFAIRENCAAILLFDIPADPVGCGESDSYDVPFSAEGIWNEIKANCATVGIMRNPRRIRDVDRVVDYNANSEQFADVLKLVSNRLEYTASPPKKSLATLPEVRLIRRQHELLDYFKLRHRVYRLMGYLDEETENAASQMEINWCDRIALHIGAYEKIGEHRESLVGTARVVVGTVADDQRKPALLASYDQWVTTLANQDPVLQQALIKGVLPLQLPIFHSQKLFTIFRESLQRNEVCGELSRVIVTQQHRGTGLSTRLVEFALIQAERVGVNRMFLECLHIHEGLYTRLGFKRIEGTAGSVISVNRTMIGMELSRRLGMSITGAISAS